MTNGMWKKAGICLLAGASLLLIGSTGLRNRATVEKKEERYNRCREAALQFQEIAPGSGWEKLAAQDPEFCIRIGHSALRLTNRKAME